MRTQRLFSALSAALLFVTSLIPISPAVSAPPPPDRLSQLQATAGSQLRVGYHRETGYVNFVGTEPGGAISLAGLSAAPIGSAEDAARAFFAGYGDLFGLKNPAADLALQRTKALADGRSVVRFQQTYQGVPVLGAELMVQIDQRGGVVAVLGETLPNAQVNTTPQISSADAAARALKITAATHGLDQAGLTASTPQLWIYAPALIGPANGPARLVWRTEVTPAALLPVRELVLVDAESGEVALHFNQVPHALSMRTYDAMGTTTLPGTIRCDETEPTCPGGNADAKAAHKFGAATYEFFMDFHGRDSYDDNGATITQTVNYGVNYQNAFWNGEQMVYGAGYASADDVVAHELSHAFTQYESNLLYYYQSGAINESFSDIWGEFVDQMTPSNDDDASDRWEMGESLPIGAIRSMADPTDYGDPDRMTSPLYNSGTSDEDDIFHDHGGVHSNSGVGNKAAYLMVDGGTFNGFTITGIGITNTAKIFYEAATNLLVSGSDYLDLYNALQQACVTVFGAASEPECVTTKRAIDAVEMNLEPFPGYNSDAALCPDGSDPTGTAFFDDLEGGLGNFVNGAITGSNRWSLLDEDLLGGVLYAHSGQNALLGNDSPGETSDSYVAISPTVTISPNAYLHFTHAFGWEGPDYDGGVLEYSTDNGATWQDGGHLFVGQGANGYNGKLINGPLAGRRAWVSDSHGYIASRAFLGSLEGEAVRFRWRMSTDQELVDQGWFLDDVRIYTCAVAETAPHTTYLPVVTQGPASHAPYTVIEQQTFEGTWPAPGSGWVVVDTDGSGGEFFPAKSNCRVYSGGSSVRLLGGGAAGGAQACHRAYPNNTEAWMVYGPFSLADAEEAEFSFKLWLNTERGFDEVLFMASGDGYAFDGFGISGTSHNTWLTVPLDLENWLGDDSVWVAIIFASDSLVQRKDGGYVDNVVIKKCVTGTCPALASSSAELDGLVAAGDLAVAPASRSLP